MSCRFRSSHHIVPQAVANFGIGTLARATGRRQNDFVEQQVSCAHAEFQSGRIGPETPSKAPSASSQTSSRAGSTGPGMVARPLGIRLNRICRVKFHRCSMTSR